MYVCVERVDMCRRENEGCGDGRHGVIEAFEGECTEYKRTILLLSGKAKKLIVPARSKLRGLCLKGKSFEEEKGGEEKGREEIHSPAASLYYINS